MAAFWNQGTITLTTDSVEVAGQGTDFNMSTLRAGDTIESDDGRRATILSVNAADGPGAIALDKPWRGAGQIEAPYKGWFTPDDVVLEGLGRKALSNLSSGNISAFAELLLEANKGFHATGEGTLATHDLTALGRAIIGAEDEEAAQTALGGSVVGRGVFGAEDATAAQTALGGTAVGRALFSAADVEVVRGAIASFGVARRQVFTSSGAYTPHPQMLCADIMCLGGGGGGAGIAGEARGDGQGSGGGGGGAVAYRFVSRADVGTSQSVTVGSAGSGGPAGNNSGSTGGTTAVGSLCSAAGGAGGTKTSGQGPGGLGGTTASGDLTFSGGTGQSVTDQIGNTLGMGGHGSPSPFGGGGRASASFNNAANGGDARSGGYGAGGAGASARNSTQTASGGSGSPGLVIIIEYCSE